MVHFRLKSILVADSVILTNIATLWYIGNYRLLMLLREGNVFSHVCLFDSLLTGAPHVTSVDLLKLFHYLGTSSRLAHHTGTPPGPDP